MATTETRTDNLDRIFDSAKEAEKTALEAVRHFLDTVNGLFPDMTADGGPRKKIIDSAFRMTEQLVETSTEFAQKVVQAGQDDQVESGKSGRA